MGKVFYTAALRKQALGMAIVAGMLSASGAQAQNAAPTTYTLTGDWTLDGGEDYCRLSANFRNGDEQVSFALERNRADSFARLILVGAGIRPFRGSETLTWSFQPSGQSAAVPFVRSETADGRPYFNLGQISFAPAGPPLPVQPPYDRAAEQTFARSVTAIEVSEGLVNPVRIETGPMESPIQALQICTDDLLAYWGLDAAKHQTMSRRAAPAGPAFEWLAADTIGFGDFASLSGARNPIRVMIDPQGKPTACAAHWQSLPERKNTAICEQLMANAHFEPALDAQGNAMASYWFAEPFMLMRPFGG